MRAPHYLALLLGIVAGLAFLLYLQQGGESESAVAPSKRKTVAPEQIDTRLADHRIETPHEDVAGSREDLAITELVPAPNRSSPPSPTEEAPEPEEHYETLKVRLLTPSGLSLVEARRNLNPEMVHSFSMVRTSVAAPELNSRLEPLDFDESPIHRADLQAQFTSNDGILELRVRSPREPAHICLLRRDRVVAFEYLSPNATEVTIVVDLFAILAEDASLRARFVAGTGELAEGDVQLAVEGSPFGMGGRIRPDNSIHWQGIKPGALTLTAKFDGFAVHVTKLELKPREFRDLGTIRLQPNTSIRGKLVGTPEEIQHRGVSLYRPNENVPLATEKTGTLGEFRFQRLEPGEYFILLNKSSWRYRGPSRSRSRRDPDENVAALEYVNTSSGDVSGVELRLCPPAQIVLRAVFSPGDPIECVLKTPEGQFVRRCELFAVDGRHHVWVAPGLYDVTWSRSGEKLGQRRIQTTNDPLWVELLED